MKRNFRNIVKIMSTLMLGLVFTLGGVSGPRVAHAADGDLDTTFNLDGKITTQFTGNSAHAYGVAIQPDGKIVAVGDTSRWEVEGTDKDFAVARYNSQGLLDIGINGGGFGGGDGKVTIDFGGFDYATSVAIQADGKIVVVGRVQASHSRWDFGVVRLNSNGTMDTTFSGDGKTNVGFSAPSGARNDYPLGVAIQANGKIVVAGWTSDSDPSIVDAQLAVVRLRSNGSLDETVISNGKAMVGFGDYIAFGMAIAIQADGKIVVVGSTCAEGGNSYNGESCDVAIARFNSNLALDTTFSGDGKVTVDLGSYGDYALAIAIQADGKIVAAGKIFNFVANGSNGAFAFMRLNTNGSLDTTFSGDGKVTVGFDDAYSEARGVAIQADGKIVAAGRVANLDDTRTFAVMRVSADGNLDTSFSDDGKVKVYFGTDYEAARAVAIQADGKIVAAGEADYMGFALVRLQSSP